MQAIQECENDSTNEYYLFAHSNHFNLINMYIKSCGTTNECYTLIFIFNFTSKKIK